MLKAATHDVDEAVKEALEERAEYLADLDAKIEAERACQKAGIRLHRGAGRPEGQVRRRGAARRDRRVRGRVGGGVEKCQERPRMQAGRSLQHYMGMKTALGEYLLVELAEAVRDVPHNEKFKRTCVTSMRG